jgi:hypothetical protein
VSTGAGVATREPLVDDKNDLGVNLNTSSTTTNGSELSTGIEGDGDQALTRDEERDHTAEVSTKEAINSSGDERGEVGEKATAHINRDVGRDGEGKPEQNNRLEFGTKAAAGTREPDSQGSTDLNTKVGSNATLSTSLEGGDDVGLKIGGDFGIEEPSEGGLGTCHQNTGLLHEAADGSTSGDGCQTARRQSANRDDASFDLTLQPGQNRGLQRNAQGALRAREPSLQGSLNVRGQISDETTGGTETKTSPDIDIEGNTKGSGEEDGQGRLGRGAENDLGGKIRGGEDTVECDVQITLSGNVGTCGDEQ